MIRFGVIGSGAIATQFVKEAMLNETIQIIGVVARNLEKTTVFAKEYEIETVYETVEEMLASTQIDAIYIASLHPTHALYSIMALESGKHVLCEKPCSLTPQQMLKIQEAAIKSGKLFMEAMTIGFHPLYQEMKAKIGDGIIGEITHIESHLGRMSLKEHKHFPNLAGGCIYDIGIYNIFFILDLLGPIQKTKTLGRKHRKWDVIGTVQVLAEHKNGAHSYSYMTMDSLSSGRAVIIGTKGTIEIEPSWSTPHKYTIKFPESEDLVYTYETSCWLGFEIAAFAKLIAQGKVESPMITWERSLEIQETIAQIYADLGIELPEEAILI
ncbi:oxidoreductase [Erysipelotrichaceae bacterium]|nr:oxidoreductase [Erysipelotrichaceae bacterium]